MANIGIFKPNETPQYLTSVSEGPYVVDINVDKRLQQPLDDTILLNPDISGVSGVPIKYWKKVNSTIVEMSQAEKDVILAAELQVRKASADNFSSDPLSIFTALIKVINLRLPVGQKITKAEMTTAVKEEIT